MKSIFAQFLLMVLVFVMMPSIAVGGVVVWQVAEPLSGNSFVDSQGTVGASLFLRCDATIDECKWRLTTRARIDDGTMAGYNVWVRDPAGPGSFLSISETDFTGTPFSVIHTAWENVSPYLSYISTSIPLASPEVPAGPTIHFLHSYVLTSEAGVPPGALTQLRAGSNGFFGTNPGGGGGGGFRPTAFGANPGFPIAGEEWPNPVIHINYVPEPSTAALLAVPALLMALTRRRRADTARL